MFVSRAIVSRLLNRSARRAYTEGGHAHTKPASMDELPKPSGSWQRQYDADQRKMNAVLVAGVAFTALTLVVAKTSGLVYLNWAPPKTLD